jgi:hypothetical protein
MVEVAKTTDPVRLGYLRSALAEAGIDSVAFDSAAGALWPGAFPNRLMVEDRDAWRARIVIEQAEAEIEG